MDYQNFSKLDTLSTSSVYKHVVKISERFEFTFNPGHCRQSYNIITHSACFGAKCSIGVVCVVITRIDRLRLISLPTIQSLNKSQSLSNYFVPCLTSVMGLTPKIEGVNLVFKTKFTKYISGIQNAVKMESK